MSSIISFSDVHLGYERTNYPSFNEFIDYIASRNDMDKIIMVGDIFDLWRYNYHDAMKEKVYSDTFYKLQSTIDELADVGIETVYIKGNHDYAVESIVGADLDVKYAHSYNIDGNMYQHGWTFDFVQTFTMFGNLITPSVYGFITEWFPAIYQRMCRKPSEIPTEEERANSSWIESIYEKASEFTTKVGATRIVMGHTHNPMIRGNIVDCGDWIDSVSWCEIDDGIPMLYNWRNDHA